MRFLGIDYGSRWIGVAVSDTAGSIAFPRTELPNNASAVPALRSMHEAEQFDRIVMGDTRTSRGDANTVTEEAERFAKEVEVSLGLPVEMASEAWTSQEAARFAPPGERHNNASAAALILQRFLDMRSRA